jgi:hypothetical protein
MSLEYKKNLCSHHFFSFLSSLQQGKHNELKKKRGLYWELIRQQEIEEEIEEMRGHFF